MKLLLKFPEYFLVLFSLAAAYTPPIHFNPIFLAIAAILVAQIVFKNRLMGVVIGAVFFLGNLFFLGALISEFSEFPATNGDALQLAVGGGSIWLLSTLMSVLMIYKYSRTSITPARS